MVYAKYCQGMTCSWNLNIFSGPKWSIVCGKCDGTFEKRLPRIDYPTIPCPYCGELNKLPIVFRSDA